MGMTILTWTCVVLWSHYCSQTNFVNSGQQNGYPFYDYNPRKQIGFTYTGVTIKDGERISANSAFLSPARHRSNLIVKTNSMVTKIPSFLLIEK